MFLLVVQVLLLAYTSPPITRSMVSFPTNHSLVEVIKAEGINATDDTFKNAALSFDGIDDYVEVSNTFFLSPKSGKITIEAWIRPNAVTSAQVIAAKYNSSISNTCWYFSVGIGGYLHFIVYEDFHIRKRGFDSAPGVIVAGVWQHVAASFDLETQEISVYRNGEKLPVKAFPGTTYISQIMGTETPMRIGATIAGKGNLTNFWKGDIDDIRIWGDVRTQSEIKNNLYQTLDGMEEGLIGYWSMNEGGGERIQDAGPHNIVGILKNGTKWASR